MSKEFFLVQSVSCGGDSILIEHIDTFAYIECASMDGNKMMARIFDHAAIYRDNLGIKQGAEIAVTFADIYHSGDQVWIEKFIVAKATSQDGQLIIEGFQKDAFELKQQAITPQFFVNKQPRQILAELLPNLRVICDSYEKGATYHLNAGGTKSRLIRTMARDYGSVAFICRGAVYFKALKNLDMTGQFTLEHNNKASAEHAIARYSIIGEESLFERVLNKNYGVWDTVTGFSSSGRDGAMNIVSVPQIKALNNQRMAIIPLLDVELSGDTRFMPLTICSVLFHKQLSFSELDESMPQLQIANRVTHYQRGGRYQCRIELGRRNL